MPGKGATPPREAPAPRYRRPPPDRVEAAARRLLASGRTLYESQAAFRRALLGELRATDPLAGLGARRLRRLLLEAGAVRLRILYTERNDRRPLARCPVCGDSLHAIRNRTLFGDRVTLGYRCHRCGYWTHLKRRVPRRYAISARRPTARRSG